jgi:hypothetical protein
LDTAWMLTTACAAAISGSLAIASFNHRTRARRSSNPTAQPSEPPASTASAIPTQTLTPSTAHASTGTTPRPTQPWPATTTPFAGPHSRATFATMMAALEYVRRRLEHCSYVVDATDARALGWLLGTFASLSTAVTGDPHLDPQTVRRRLRELDSSLCPESWWRKSQHHYRTLDGSTRMDPNRPTVPDFADIYKAVFADELARRPLSKRQARKLRSQAIRSGLAFDAHTSTLHDSTAQQTWLTKPQGLA